MLGQVVIISILIVSVFFKPFNCDFKNLDKEIWSIGNHNLGLGYINPQNVDIINSNLRLKSPAEKYDGAEIYTTQKHGYGSYLARLKCPMAPGSLTAFFLYNGPEGKNNEIDIEIYNDSTGRIDLSTWVNGKKTHVDDWDNALVLPFDPTQDFHNYRIDYYPKAVSFYVDGILLQSWKRDIPSDKLHVLLNIWWPEWLANNKPAKDSYAEVDKVSFFEITEAK